MTARNRSNLTALCAFLLGALGAASLAAAQQKNMPNAASWSGVIINSNCTVDEAFAEAAKCTEKGAPGGKLSLYDDTARLVLHLEPQDQAAGRLGDAVTVEGALDGDTIRVASIKPLAGIGLAVGQKAPPFSAADQFGTTQTLDTLKGPKGTVLLFFRSADW
jgi:hypothetical protein